MGKDQKKLTDGQQPCSENAHGCMHTRMFTYIKLFLNAFVLDNFLLTVYTYIIST